MFTIFGHSGFLGSNLVKFLKKNKVFLPPKKKFIFKKNLGNIIYCIGSDDWKKDTYNSFYANLGYIPLILNNNKFKSFTFISSCRIYNNSINTEENCPFKFNPTNSSEYYNLKKILAENYLFASNKKPAASSPLLYVSSAYLMSLVGLSIALLKKSVNSDKRVTP